MFSCEYCKIFKNNYFEEHPRTAASEILFFKTDVLKYLLKVTEWHLYWSVFLMKLHALKPRKWKHENYECFT